jgi:hypothetical protein
MQQSKFAAMLSVEERVQQYLAMSPVRQLLYHLNQQTRPLLHSDVLQERNEAVLYRLI